LWIRFHIDFGRLDPNLDPEGQKCEKKLKKGKNEHKNRSEAISCFEVDVESFSCSLDVFKRGIGIKK
jgi:hypothetical protein